MLYQNNGEVYNDPAATGKIQKVAVMIHVRFKVTICLFLIHNNRPRSLSTLIAVNVNRNTEHNAKLYEDFTSCVSTKTSLLMNQRRPMRSIETLGNKTNKQILKNKNKTKNV